MLGCPGMSFVIQIRVEWVKPATVGARASELCGHWNASVFECMGRCEQKQTSEPVCRTGRHARVSKWGLVCAGMNVGEVRRAYRGEQAWGRGAGCERPRGQGNPREGVLWGHKSRDVGRCMCV